MISIGFVNIDRPRDESTSLEEVQQRLERGEVGEGRKSDTLVIPRCTTDEKSGGYASPVDERGTVTERRGMSDVRRKRQV